LYNHSNSFFINHHFFLFPPFSRNQSFCGGHFLFVPSVLAPLPSAEWFRLWACPG